MSEANIGQPIKLEPAHNESAEQETHNQEGTNKNIESPGLQEENQGENPAQGEQVDKSQVKYEFFVIFFKKRLKNYRKSFRF